MKNKLKNEKLQEIDDLYKSIERFKAPTLRKVTLKTEEGRMEYQEKREWISSIFNQAVTMLMEEVTNLSVEDIIDGFYNGSEMLQGGMSGVMGHFEDFNRVYIPIMIEAVKKDGPKPLYGFLLRLSENLPRDEVEELVIIGLGSDSFTMIDTALNLVRKMNFVGAKPKLRELFQYPDQRISNKAGEIFALLENK